MLEVNDLSFDYEDRPILNQLSFVLKKGQLLYLGGDNGSGKTTLLRLIAGLLYPQAGQIYYQGKLIFDNLYDYQQQLCFVGHRSGISPWLTVKENCYFDLQWGRRSLHFADLLERFRLTPFENVICASLSAGQRRRVGLMRTVLSNASLWLLDEPLVALDVASINLFMQILKRHLEQGGLAIVTSHQDLPLDWTAVVSYVL